MPKGFTIASDLVLSLLPVTFLRSLNRPLHEKVLIGCLMGAGLGATGVAIARLFLIMGYLGKGGPSVNMLQDILWGLELTVGVLAASVPTLKAPVHRVLRRWGVLRGEPTSSNMSPNSFLDNMTNGSHFTHQMRQWDGARGADSNKRPFMYSVPSEPNKDDSG